MRSNDCDLEGTAEEHEFYDPIIARLRSMSVLSKDKPAKIHTTEEHNEMYSSDTGVPGTYTPNMSWEDAQRWKAKRVKDRVEIRKSVAYAQIVLVVTKNNVTMSMNGKSQWTNKEWDELSEAVNEAREWLNK